MGSVVYGQRVSRGRHTSPQRSPALSQVQAAIFKTGAIRGSIPAGFGLKLKLKRRRETGPLTGSYGRVPVDRSACLHSEVTLNSNMPPTMSPLCSRCSAVTRHASNAVTRHASIAVTRHASTSSPMPSPTQLAAAGGVSLSGSGWLLPFHIGVLTALQRRGLLLPTTPLAGASGGALVAVAHACGLPPDDLMAGARQLAGWARSHRVWGGLGSPLRELCREMLPPDAHALCSGRVAVAVTRVWPLSLRPLLVREYGCREDVVDAVYCSSFIPFYLESATAREWRGQWWVDGGAVQYFAARAGACPFLSLPICLVHLPIPADAFACTFACTCVSISVCICVYPCL